MDAPGNSGPHGWLAFESFFKGCVCVDGNDDTAVQVVDESNADRSGMESPTGGRQVSFPAQIVDSLEATPENAHTGIDRNLSQRLQAVQNNLEQVAMNAENSMPISDFVQSAKVASPDQVNRSESMAVYSASGNDWSSRLTGDSLFGNSEHSPRSLEESLTASPCASASSCRRSTTSRSLLSKGSRRSIASSKSSLTELLTFAENQEGWEPIVEAELQEAIVQVPSEIKPWISKDYTFQCMLGKACGNFGRVDLMQRQDDGSTLAAKRIPNIWMRDQPSSFASRFPESFEKPWQDIAFLMLLQKHKYPYSCRLQGVFRDSSHTYILTNVATQGDLFRWCIQPGLNIDSHREHIVLPVATQLFLAVRTLHDLGVAHRNLSLDNVVLTSDKTHSSSTSRLKLIDFGMATLTRTSKREVCGKQVYRAPEMHGEPSHDTFIADNFAAGIVLFALIARTYPWRSSHPRDGDTQYQCFKSKGIVAFLEDVKNEKGESRSLADKISPQLAEILGGLLHWDPKQRMCMGESVFRGTRSSVLDMAWLQEAEDDNPMTP
eukprot:TRINITY_DN26525_c0_g1_i1.p1 TRINITY_DN26525_c0_g1~~TRINITY_DN26525_c0_g1_i1.p1  ORF type:complete len:549 (+),score=82.58 TRINITY_DN26525_c0_g1_i1:26-1672(+)